MNSCCPGSAGLSLLKIRRFSTRLLVGCGALLWLFGPAPAQAEQVTWFASDGVWDVASNWWPHKVPVAGDVVWVKAPEAAELVVTYRDATSPALTTAFFDSVGTGTLRLLQSQDQLIVTTQHVGYTGTASLELSGGTHSVAANLNLGVWPGSDGTYDLSGTGALSANAEVIGSAGTGRFLHSAGPNAVTGGFHLGFWGSGDGSYDLSGTGALSATREYLGDFGTGLFTHSGGANSISESLVLGNWWSGVGTYELSGTGSLEAADEYLGVLGEGSVVQSGGVNTVANTLYLGFFPGSQGDYDLQGGALDAGHVNNNINSHFAYTGGSLTASTFLNVGELDLGGVGTRTVAGAVTNNGVVRATDTEAVFTEAFTNAGAYVSEQSDNHFADLVVDPAGYLSGAQGSRFFVTGDLMMSSNWAEFWDTALAGLIVGVSPDHEHTLAYTGQDLGDSYAGYVTNFAWGTLSVADGESLVLQDGDLVAGGALYVSVLDLQGGLDQIASVTGNGLNIYYDVQQAENGYLNGQAYPLAGGGSIVPVPEPTALLLLGSGVAALALAQWRRGRGETSRA